MNRKLSLVGATLCALSLAGCNASDLSALNGIPPNQPPSVVVSDVLAGAGVSTATTAKVNASISTVQKAALALCNIKPLANGILNIGLALSPSLGVVVNSGTAQQIGGVATIACDALSRAPIYTSTARGQMVSAIAHVNGKDVPVSGIRY